MDTTKTITHIGLCAGYGGIELGLKRVIPSMRSVALCEIEAFAIANLVSKMEAGLMDAAPIWTNLKTFPWSEFRDRVDILTGGYPCQPFSAAGKRLGTDDPRHLWPFIADGIRILRPKLCLFENVEGHISLGLSTVISDLEELGYKVSWGIFSASVDAGAPHQRKRVFILAYREGERLPQFTNIGAIGREVCTTALGGKLANGDEQRLERGIQQGVTPKEKQDEFVAGYGCTLANSNSARSREDRQSSESWAACLEQSPSDSWRSESGQIREGQAWPSRPGEPQHAWEPPRVVADTSSRRRQQTRVECRSGEVAGVGGREEGSRHQQAAHSNNEGCDGRNEEESGSNAEAMGNAECLCISASREHGAMDEASGIPADREWSESAQTDPESSATRKREGNWADASECGEIKFKVGRDAYESFIGVGFSELSGLSDSELAEICDWMVKTDNRTDELRLLGNGVVPSTATRAFLTLWEELNK